MPVPSQPVQSATSLRSTVLLLLGVCIVPGLLVSLFLAYRHYELRRDEVYAETLRLAQKLIERVDQEFAGIESGLKVLATSDTLRTGDLAAFQTIATGAVKSQIVYNYVLTDSEGRQHLNTLRPYGTALPTTGTPPQLEAVFVQGRTVLTDYFIGPVTRKPAIAMGVPVLLTEGEVRYSLNIGLAPDKLKEVLRASPLMEGGIVALLDTSGTIVARIPEVPEFVGEKVVPALWTQIRERKSGITEATSKEGIEVITAYATSDRWHWSVAVGAPKAKIEAQLNAQLGWIGLVTSAVLGFALWIALRIVKRLADSVEALNQAAIDIGKGVPVTLPEMPIAETNVIGRALVHASALSAQIYHKAYHDALTGLANRSLFFKALDNCLVRGRSDGEPFSVLMVDLDYFKEVNDHDGHAIGDCVLKAVAERLRAEVRDCDVVARLGGDEFAILLVGADRGIAVDVAERLNHQLASPYPESQIAVSASIGVAIWNPAIQDGKTLLEMADRALYRGKSNGRHTVQVAESGGGEAPA